MDGQQDPIPTKARWVGFVVGVVVVLTGVGLALMGGNTLANKPGYIIEGLITLLGGILVIWIGGMLAGGSWTTRPRSRPPHG